jgi:hypothetical protein
VALEYAPPVTVVPSIPESVLALLINAMFPFAVPGVTAPAIVTAVPCVIVTAVVAPFNVSVVDDGVNVTEFQFFARLNALTVPRPVAMS